MISVHDKAIVSHWVSTSTTFQRPYIHTTVLWLSTVSTKNQLSLTVDVQGRWCTGEVICWYLSNICLVIYVIFSYRWITSLGYSFSDTTPHHRCFHISETNSFMILNNTIEFLFKINVHRNSFKIHNFQHTYYTIWKLNTYPPAVSFFSFYVFFNWIRGKIIC